MTMLAEFEETGRLWLRRLFSKEDLQTFAASFDSGSKPGIRLQLTEALRPLLGNGSNVANELFKLGDSPSLVRLIAFDKSGDTNWGVPWHQDRVIAVKQRSDVIGYDNWIRKSDFWHCEPPIDLLSEMLFVRIHIDPCDASNGAMEIALGSHKHGFIKSSDASSLANACPLEVCEAEAGDVLILKALILHRSGVAAQPSRRRTLRVDYAKRDDLHRELQWAITDA
ncbi:MAG: phytanoyl-CoA dioxygenase family protein [Pseudomonadota bacterium]